MFKGLFGRKEAHSAPAAKKSQGGAFVKSAARALGLSTAASWTSFIGRTLLSDGFEGNTWVMACVRKRYQSLGSVPIVVQTKKDGQWEQDTESPIHKLLSNPNPQMSGGQLVSMISAQLDIQGSFFAKIVRGGPGGKVPLEIWPLPIGSVVAMVRGVELKGYEYTPKGRSPVPLSIEDVLHIKYTHPDSPHEGMPPLLAAGKAVDIDNESAQWQKITMQNRGVPDGVFVLKGSGEEPIGPDEWEEARRQVRTQYATRDSAREPWVLSNAEYKQMSLTPVDLDFMEGRRMTRSEICAALDVPEPLVGIYDNATLANIETARKIFWLDSLSPWLTVVSSALTSYFAPSFRTTESRIIFDTTSVPALRGSMKDKTETAIALAELGVPLSVINERLELGLKIDDIPGARIAYMTAGRMPIQVGDDSGVTDQQFDRLMKIIDSVATGSMPLTTAISLALTSVPSMSRDDVVAILSPSEPDGAQ